MSSGSSEDCLLACAKTENGVKERERGRVREAEGVQMDEHKIDREKRETERGEGMCQRGTAGTLTPLDYPMNRNVIYGSFTQRRGGLKGRVCITRADRTI